MGRILAFMAACLALAGCVSRPPVSPAPAPELWAARVAALQGAAGWRLDGRAAVAFGNQGWQAGLDWRQERAESDLRLAGPFGMGALQIHRGPGGLSLNGADPKAAGLEQLQEKLGFDLPIDDLRYWLLGVPKPGIDSTVERNGQDRARQLLQDGWRVDYDNYRRQGADLLPARIELSREGVRVRIAVDHWQGLP